MILVTGATGFMGQALVRQLTETGQQVRVLLRPSPVSPRLPKGVPVEVAVDLSFLQEDVRICPGLRIVPVENECTLGHWIRVASVGFRIS